MTSTQHATLAAADCDMAFDDLTRQLYATDASLYQLEPAAVAFGVGGAGASVGARGRGGWTDGRRQPAAQLAGR